MQIDAPIGKWIAKLYKHHDQFVDKLLEPLSINHSEGNMLIYLYKDGDGISQKTLQENLGVDKATVSRSVNSLIQKGYIRKESSPEDGRVNLIYLTKKAKEFEKKIKDIYQKWFDIFLKEISEKDTKIVLNTLKKMYEMVQGTVD
ncbi:MarR family winged helix-turn-helix transcriptional regulator [Halanaerobium hydrogeniformans]|uniref:Transcriptional regulator, MarR family n=1 Tax=Halanaerobium hydrogeniformans TaxID=656519 RepID=E4RN56_HALHG|nr:MarR family transcriptional regulator [Halanaerobium hydrogeniformans]ADQ14273.1 transcriptional regulator, MarR family [Halanaerobium hydrogeniformans]